jgi:adenosylmethionine-8-amino-7-oxononanoate aminotransferase
MSRGPAASAVFHRDPRYGYPVAVGGDGPYLIDSAGKRYLDGSGGAAVSCLGHSDAAITEAIATQVRRLPFAHTSFFTNEPMEALAADLTAHAPAGITQAYFVSDGSEAIEAALKLARQYFLEVGEPQRTRVIARRQSYHGNTLGALAVGGNAFRRAPFEPLLMDVSHVSPCYPYRDLTAGESLEAYGERLARELEAEIIRLGPKTVIAFVAETVGGATLGAQPPVPGYFARAREVCDRHGVLLVLDEVMCGMGRCGTLYACEAEAVVPDLLAIGKGLAAGYEPIGALLVHRRIYEAVLAGSGFFQHGHTYSGHPVACAAALAVQQAIHGRGLIERVRSAGAVLQRLLAERFEHHPNIGEIRGRGLLWGLELVADRATKAPFETSRQLSARLKRQALENGLLCYPMSGTIDGLQGDHVLLAPPYIVSPAHLEELVDKLARSLDQVL